MNLTYLPHYTALFNMVTTGTTSRGSGFNDDRYPKFASFCTVHAEDRYQI